MDAISRRDVMKLLASASLAPALLTFGCRQAVADPWDVARSIRAVIKLPRIPGRDFLITDFGANGNGKNDCTGAIT
ncbi:MAG: hypothetical protein OQJ84_07995, partial [Xanthomonadales bacterium]|nr:hypothetical protein [Xanthomonadales bacterium]